MAPLLAPRLPARAPCKRRRPPPSCAAQGDDARRKCIARFDALKRDGAAAVIPGFGITPSDDAHAAYLLPERRFVNINLMWVKDLSFEKAQFRAHAPGGIKATAKASTSTARCFGEPASPTPTRARCALLADKIVMMLSVENAKTPNEALEWLQKIDLKSLAAFARNK